MSTEVGRNQVETIKLHKGQWEAYNFTKPYGFAICGTKGGKTFLGALWAQKKITELELGTGLIAAPTNKILEQATLDTFFKLFPEYRKFHKKQENVLYMPAGGKIYIRSTDEPLSIEGLNLDWAWLDEVGMMSRLVWSIAKNKLAISGGQLLGTTNAYYLNWLYKEVYIPWLEKVDEEIEVFNWASTDNPYFPEKFAEQERARLSPAEFARRYEGKFVRMEGLVYEIDESHIIDCSGEYLKFPEKCIAGVDWGYTNPAGIVVIKIQNGKYYVVDEWKQSKRTTDEIVQKCREFNKQYQIQTWYPDPAEPDRIDTMQKHHLQIGDVNKDVPLGISKVSQLFKEHRLFVCDKCPDLQDELDEYRYEIPKEDRSGKEIPVKVNDHLVDALRYAVLGNELGQIYTYQEELVEKERIEENRQSKKEFELL
jgi:PBSX family phage terminase large subunit